MITTVVTIARIGRTVRAIAIAIVIIIGLLVAVAQVRAEVVATMVIEGVRTHYPRITSEAVSAIIAVDVVAVRIVRTAVSAVILLVDDRSIVVVERTIAVNRVDTEVPRRTACVDGSIEVGLRHEANVLACRHDKAQVVITIVEIAIIAIDGIVVSVHHIGHKGRYVIDEIIVDLVAILILHGGKVQFVCHTIGEETCVITDIANLHRRGSRNRSCCGNTSLKEEHHHQHHG